MNSLAVGLAINIVVGVLAFLRKSVTVSGMISGIFLGTGIYLFGGFLCWSMLMGFFISSSVLSFYRKSSKKEVEALYEKTGNRDYGQVFANGLVGFVMAALFLACGDHVFILGCAAAFAATNADTWASEIGVFSENDPVSIVTFQRVPRGTSGGVSLLGIAASAVGAFFIAVVFIIGYYLVYGSEGSLALMALLVVAGGLMGSIVDSVLGATIQAQYRCTQTGKITEKKIRLGKPTVLVRGWWCINNDMVNFLSSLIAALSMSFLYQAIV